MDDVEREYERAIKEALSKLDHAAAVELSVGLDQYRDLYKTTPAGR